MAAIYATVPFATVALTATTAKSVAGVNPAANFRVRLLEYKVSFDGANSANAPVVVDLNMCTFATNAPGTASTSVTPTPKDQDVSETLQTAAAKNWTSEPTVQTTIMDETDVGQFNGVYHYICPFAAPWVLKNAKGAVVRATSPNNVNCSGKLEYEE